jgi:hypothetical protein
MPSMIENPLDFHIGDSNQHATSSSKMPTVEVTPSMAAKVFKLRQYKKDSIYVNDLYTLTYDNHESLDMVQLISAIKDVRFERKKDNFFC